MTMQRRHFELIAEVIAKELHGEHREKAAYAFAYVLPMTNRRFDSQGFLEACKVNAFTEGGNQSRPRGVFDLIQITEHSPTLSPPTEGKLIDDRHRPNSSKPNTPPAIAQLRPIGQGNI